MMMPNQVFEFLARLPLFAGLPEEELTRLAGSIAVERYPKGTLLSTQGRTKLNCLYIVREGSLELFYDQSGQKELSGLLQPGETFGGICILMNAGISVRSVAVHEEAILYVLPQDVFLDICTRFKNFYEYFADKFRQRMRNEAYASIVVAGQALHFLSKLVPFSFLPESELVDIAAAISVINYPRDTILFVQGQSKVEYLYIMQKGAAERYFQENDKKTLRGMLAEGDMFGGISLLLNKGIAIRTLRVTENSYFYTLPKEKFFDICQRHEAFSDYFTDTFGKRMLDRSYAEIIATNFKPREDALAFFSLPVEGVLNKELIFCDKDMPIQAAAAVMSEHNCSSIFIREGGDDFVGVVTDNDLRRKVIATGCDILRPVAEIMSSPLSTISVQALVFEALMEMMQKNIKHLAVRDEADRIVGVVTNQDLLKAQGQSPFFIMREIAQAKIINQIFLIHHQIPRLIENLINTGAKAKNVTRFLTTVSDAVLRKIIDFALGELGPAPVPFVFMILGSEGRKEQTLKTDQDNAIVFEDVPAKSQKQIQAYFLNLGAKVCNWLDEAGYAFCKGGVMAKNPKWCQPLATWKEYFSKWIRTAAPETLLQASIFFDLRGAHGDMDFIVRLRKHLFDALVGWKKFFRHLAENASYFKPPIGFFRNFVVASKGEHRDTLDIKAAMQPIVDFARIYALHNQIEETNTLERLLQLANQKALTLPDYNELETAYSYLMQMRFIRQVKALVDENAKPDNYINPKKLSRIEQTMLKEIFKRIEKYQAKLHFDFTGLA
ncbi:MAG: cyclic nucleotide-binding domain-containing protein [Desulfobacterales bacterium]|nr:MAG: cyclic nucleotide-binding domain-containing protein [Desulfobacterales bacterium]